REALDRPAPVATRPGFHHCFGIACVVAIGADCDPAHFLAGSFGLRRVVIAVEAPVTFHQVDIMFGRHVAAATPILVAQAEEGNLVWCLAAVDRTILPG